MARLQYRVKYKPYASYVTDSQLAYARILLHYAAPATAQPPKNKLESIING